MSLYLCVFRGDEELFGVDVGRYADWERFRGEARARDGRVFRRYGTLRMHVAPTTDWSPRQAARLARELEALREELRREPPREFPPESWQAQLVAERGLRPATLADCYFDVDGVSLFDGMLELCRLAVETREAILLQ